MAVLETALKAGRIVCPTCRAPDSSGRVSAAPLGLGRVDRVDRGGAPLHGLLRCTRCPAAFPLVDGVAVVVKDTAAWIRAQERTLFWRDDLPWGLEDWLRRAWGEDADPNWHRQMLAVYGRPLMRPEDQAESALPEAILGLVGGWENHHADRRRRQLSGADLWALDAGCALGAGALDASRHARGVVALDKDFGALRLLARLLREGEAPVARWRHGGADHVPAQLVLPEGTRPERVVVVAGDALEPPLAARSFGLVEALNLLDNVREPVLLLRQLHGLLEPGGLLTVSSPFDWSPQATPPGQRLGEALRAQEGPDPGQALVALLEGRFGTLTPELAMTVLSRVELPWVLPRHRRSAHVFVSTVVEAVKAHGAP